MRNAFRLWYVLFDSIAKVCLASCFSEFSGAMEYLKLLNSFLDSMGSGAPPFASNSVLKSSVGKSGRTEALPAAGTTTVMYSTSHVPGKEKRSHCSETWLLSSSTPQCGTAAQARRGWLGRLVNSSVCWNAGFPGGTAGICVAGHIPG